MDYTKYTQLGNITIDKGNPGFNQYKETGFGFHVVELLLVVIFFSLQTGRYRYLNEELMFFWRVKKTGQAIGDVLGHIHKGDGK